MSELNVKMDLIKLDMVVKDIHRIWTSTSSSYLFPKSLLAQSRSYVRSDVKRALSLAEKSRKHFREESALATIYNTVSERIQFSSDQVRRCNSDYLRHLSEGDYVGAKNALDVMLPLLSNQNDTSNQLCVRLMSHDDDGAVVSFTNNGRYLLAVTRLVISKGSDVVKTEPRKVFTIQAGTCRDVRVSAPPPFSVLAEYSENGDNRTLEAEL